MTPGKQRVSLRIDRPEFQRLAWAFGLSLALHLFCFGSFQLVQYLEIPRRLAELLRQVEILAALVAPPPQAAPVTPPPEIDLRFVDVNPAIAITEPPPNARFRSDKNSDAANPTFDRITDMPKIDGAQTDVVKAEDVPRAERDMLRPQPPRQEREQEAERARPRTPEQAGEVVMARPEANLRQDDGTAEVPKPRTVREALMAQNRNQLVGRRMQQEGGVQRLRIDPGFDVRSTAFGAYDAMFIDAVQSRWYTLLDNISYDGYRRGKVVLRFRLHQDGKISDLEVIQENVGTTLSLMCQKAVLDPAPYERWPREMRLTHHRDYRELTFTFAYNLE